MDVPSSSTYTHPPVGVPVAVSAYQKKKKRARSLFYTDLEDMLYGFGDDWPPDASAVTLVDGLVTAYLGDLTSRAVEVADLRGKLDKESFMFLVRKDKKKFSRVHKLIKTNEELKAVQTVELDPDA